MVKVQKFPQEIAQFSLGDFALIVHDCQYDGLAEFDPGLLKIFIRC